jgi:Family of unknown function (DUF6461)
MTAAADFMWAESPDGRLEAISITLRQPADPKVIDILRPRSRYEQPMTVEEALRAELDVEDYAWGSVLVQVDALDDWTMLVEPNGWVASTPETLADLSLGGTAINVFWNVNAAMQFGLARDGALVRLFDPLLYEDSREALPEERELEWGVGHPRASALALVERLTGIRIDRDWLLGRGRLSYLVPLEPPG